MAEEIEVRAAGWIHRTEGRTVEGRSARLVSGRVQRHAYVDQLTVRQCKLRERVRRPGIALVVVPYLVVAEVGPGQNPEVHSQPVCVDGGFPILEEQLFRALVNCGKRRSFINVSGIAHPESNA